MVHSGDQELTSSFPSPSLVVLLISLHLHSTPLPSMLVPCLSPLALPCSPSLPLYSSLPTPFLLSSSPLLYFCLPWHSSSPSFLSVTSSSAPGFSGYERHSFLGPGSQKGAQVQAPTSCRGALREQKPAVSLKGSLASTLDCTVQKEQKIGTQSEIPKHNMEHRQIRAQLGTQFEIPEYKKQHKNSTTLEQTPKFQSTTWSTHSSTVWSTIRNSGAQGAAQTEQKIGAQSEFPSTKWSTHSSTVWSTIRNSGA